MPSSRVEHDDSSSSERCSSFSGDERFTRRDYGSDGRGSGSGVSVRQPRAIHPADQNTGQRGRGRSTRQAGGSMEGEAAEKALRNARERHRCQQIIQAYTELKSVLPSLHYEELSRVEILRRTIRYMNYLVECRDTGECDEDRAAEVMRESHKKRRLEGRGRSPVCASNTNQRQPVATAPTTVRCATVHSHVKLGHPRSSTQQPVDKPKRQDDAMAISLQNRGRLYSMPPDLETTSAQSHVSRQQLSARASQTADMRVAMVSSPPTTMKAVSSRDPTATRGIPCKPQRTVQPIKTEARPRHEPAAPQHAIAITDFKVLSEYARQNPHWRAAGDKQVAGKSLTKLQSIFDHAYTSFCNRINAPHAAKRSQDERDDNVNCADELHRKKRQRSVYGETAQARQSSNRQHSTHHMPAEQCGVRRGAAESQMHAKGDNEGNHHGHLQQETRVESTPAPAHSQCAYYRPPSHTSSIPFHSGESPMVAGQTPVLLGTPPAQTLQQPVVYQLVSADHGHAQHQVQVMPMHSLQVPAQSQYVLQHGGAPQVQYIVYPGHPTPPVAATLPVAQPTPITSTPPSTVPSENLAQDHADGTSMEPDYECTSPMRYTRQEHAIGGSPRRPENFDVAPSDGDGDGDVRPEPSHPSAKLVTRSIKSSLERSFADPKEARRRISADIMSTPHRRRKRRGAYSPYPLQINGHSVGSM
eukprot:scpid48141/ scgid27852/ 